MGLEQKNCSRPSGAKAVPRGLEQKTVQACPDARSDHKYVVFEAMHLNKKLFKAVGGQGRAKGP